MTEDARAGAEVARLEAEDPDGRDDELRFHIHSGAKDNFVIDSKSGVLSVAPDANLDIQRSGDTYDIQVQENYHNNNNQFSLQGGPSDRIVELG